MDQIREFTLPTEVKGNWKYIEWWHRHGNMLLNMVMMTEFYDLAKSAETILENLVGEKTAVVTPLECFEQDWATFQKVTTETGTRFGHNLNMDDGLFRMPRFYMVSERLGKEHGNVIQNRLRGLMQSGLYALWKKWDRFKDQIAVKR